MRYCLIVTFAMFTASAWAQEVPKSPPKVEPKAAPKEAPKEIPLTDAEKKAFQSGLKLPLTDADKARLRGDTTLPAPAGVVVVPWPGGVWPVDGKSYPAGAFDVTYNATQYQLVTQQRQQCVGGVCQLIECPVLVLKNAIGAVGSLVTGGCAPCAQSTQAARCVPAQGCGQPRGCFQSSGCGQSRGCGFGFSFKLGGFFSCR